MAKVVVRRWPLTLTLPFGASLAMFLVALATTQIALLLQEDREIRALESKAAIFLDAVADGVALSLADGPDAARALLGGKLRVREALADEGLGLRWIDGAGTLHVLTPGDGDDREIADLVTLLRAEPPGALRFTIRERWQPCTRRSALQPRGRQPPRCGSPRYGGNPRGARLDGAHGADRDPSFWPGLLHC